MLFDDERLAGERRQIVVIEAEALPISRWHVDGAHPLRRAWLTVDHLDRLGTEVASQHRPTSGPHGRFVEVELVRIDGALDHGLAETVGGGDEDHIAKARVGVQREHHAARPAVRAHHLLDTCRQCNLGVIESLMDAIGDRPIVEQRGEHMTHRFNYCSFALHVEEGFLLAREGGLGQVLSGC